ncbi:Aldo/keto reductase [Faunimonas pinastri]|uniref:Aldo/keto reductase n=1 Tax=Faunimonas pinastri TaxID=1855383 RepID=A0A1H9QJM5_9HYPH|nr:aldo/keto reductase [Faunimonas pinastri]SER60617.1 Aldo/keto reductase [Faunimonas pinastri]
MTLSISANGAEIPTIGFGTWRLTGDTAIHMVQAALENGYRHIDTAAAYGNEAEVGEAIRTQVTPRDRIFVTTKVWHTDLADGALQRSAEASLKKLGLDQVDLLLIHWPGKNVPLAEQIKALCDARRRGLARHIGVSNFTLGLLDEAVRLADEPLVVNQVEHHPYLDQSRMLAACRKHGMAMTSYSPIGRGELLNDPLIAEIAEGKGKTAAQIVLRWHVEQPANIAIPRSSNARRVAENIDIFDFALTPEEMGRISLLAKPDGRMVNPEFGPDWD